jgi:hypothetical protein
MIRIVAPHFVAGVVFNEIERGTVVQAAPIVRYMLGWNAARVKSYCKQKRWTWTAWI